MDSLVDPDRKILKLLKLAKRYLNVFETNEDSVEQVADEDQNTSINTGITNTDSNNDRMFWNGVGQCHCSLPQFPHLLGC